MAWPSRRDDPRIVPSIAQESGLFTPDAMIWKVTRESVVILGGSSAILLQLAHPKVAAGVRDHSYFRTDPIGRLRRTYDLTLDLVFGTQSQMVQAVERINRRHRGVQGPTYSATDPELLLWVQATLVYSALTAYRAFVGPLSEAERDQYYQDTKEIGALLGVPRALYPPRIADFDQYFNQMLASGAVAVGEDARVVTETLLHLRFPLVGGVPLKPLKLIATGLLPPVLRAQYGLPWGPAQRAAFRVCRRVLRTVVPVAPSLIRTLPPARLAYRRLAA